MWLPLCYFNTQRTQRSPFPPAHAQPQTLTWSCQRTNANIIRNLAPPPPTYNVLQKFTIRAVPQCYCVWCDCSVFWPPLAPQSSGSTKSWPKAFTRTLTTSSYLLVQHSCGIRASGEEFGGTIMLGFNRKVRLLLPRLCSVSCWNFHSCGLTIDEKLSAGRRRRGRPWRDRFWGQCWRIPHVL